MHAITCKLCQQGSIAYAMLPTYYKPSIFMPCKVYIEYVWNGDMQIFYHATIQELLMSLEDALKTLPTAQVRCIDRRTHALSIQRIPLTIRLDKSDIESQIQSWHGKFILDIPAPFIVPTEQDLHTLQSDIKQYFTKMANDI